MMLKDRLAILIGKANYVKYVMYINNLYHAFRPFRHPAAPLMRRLFIPRGGVVFDIGANVGRCTALAAKAVGKSGRVYSFEPVPMALRVLRTMVRLRGFQQVIVIDAALADKKAKGSQLNIFEVTEVRDQSPSLVSGIFPGDIVLSVNGIEAKELDLYVLNGYLNSKPCRKIKLEISRKGEKIRKEIELKDQI